MYSPKGCYPEQFLHKSVDSLHLVLKHGWSCLLNFLKLSSREFYYYTRNMIQVVNHKPSQLLMGGFPHRDLCRACIVLKRLGVGQESCRTSLAQQWDISIPFQNMLSRCDGCVSCSFSQVESCQSYSCSYWFYISTYCTPQSLFSLHVL